MPEPTARRRLCLRTYTDHLEMAQQAVLQADPTAVFDASRNPVTLWVVTRLTWQEAELLPGVCLALESCNQRLPQP